MAEAMGASATTPFGAAAHQAGEALQAPAVIRELIGCLSHGLQIGSWEIEGTVQSERSFLAAKASGGMLDGKRPRSYEIWIVSP